MATEYLIPFTGLKRQYAALREELLEASDRVYSSGDVLDGRHVSHFEDAVAQRCNRQYAVAVNSATQGLIFTLQSITGSSDIQDILIPALSYCATVNSVIYSQHQPRFCDTDSQGLLDILSINYTLSDEIRALMYANLWGHVLDYDQLCVVSGFFNQNIPVIEDAAQSFGAHYKGRPSGSLGLASVLSFDPTKNLPNYGSGGMVLTDSAQVYEAILDLRDNGKYYANSDVGTNSKMSESDCAQMLVKLKYFDQWQQRRTEIANYYTDRLKDRVELVLPGTDVVSAWHKFVIKTNQGQRHRLQTHLGTKGVETKIHYPYTLPDLSISKFYKTGAPEFCPQASEFIRRSLSLPIYPELLDSEVEYVAESVLEAI